MKSNKSLNGYEGYCIDLINRVAELENFQYTIEEVADGRFGDMDDNGTWNGVVKKLKDKEADIGLGSMSIMAERELVVDFTLPIYDLVGLTIMMQRPTSPSSLHKFVNVLEKNVWLAIAVSGLFTSFLVWAFNRWSPYSYRNNTEKYKDEEKLRDFNFQQSLWFVITSLTAQGGGRTPKNLSGIIVTGIWWIFG